MKPFFNIKSNDTIYYLVAILQQKSSEKLAKYTNYLRSLSNRYKIPQKIFFEEDQFYKIFCVDYSTADKILPLLIYKRQNGKKTT